MPVADDELRAHLARRVSSDSLSHSERRVILDAVRAGRHAREHLPRWIGWAAAAAAVAVLAALVANARPVPIASSPSPEASSVAVATGSPTPTAEATPKIDASQQPPIARPGWVIDANQLAGLARDASWTGRVVVAHAFIDREALIRQNRRGPACITPLSCPVAILSEADPPIDVYSDGVSVPDENGNHAFRVRLNSVEYLGTLTAAGDGIASEVPALLAAGPQAASADTYAVRGWLVGMLPMACPAPQEFFKNPDVDLSYYCGGTWITDAPVYTQTPVEGGYELTQPDGIRVQNGSYETFAPDPSHDQSRGPEPREGLYLVRPAGCPRVIDGGEDCPVWKIVGRVDDPVLATSAPFPRQLEGEPVLTVEAVDARIESVSEPFQFLVGGWVVFTQAECFVPPDFPTTPLLAPCDDGFRLISEPWERGGDGPSHGVRLVVDAGVGSFPDSSAAVVLRVHAHDVRAADCPPDYRARCKRAVVLDAVEWTRSAPAPVPSARTLPTPDFSDYVNDELIVTFCSRPTRVQLDAFAAEHELELIPRRYGVPDLHLFKIADGVDAHEKRTAVREDERVCRVPLNWLGEPM